MSFYYNHSVLMGRLTKKPEVKQIKDSDKCSFTLAVNRPYRREDGEYATDFINIVAWGKLAETCARILDKGDPCLIDGRIQIRSYEKDNTKRWMTEIVADNFQLLKKADMKKYDGIMADKNEAKASVLTTEENKPEKKK